MVTPRGAPVRAHTDGVCDKETGSDTETDCADLGAPRELSNGGRDDDRDAGCPGSPPDHRCRSVIQILETWHWLASGGGRVTVQPGQKRPNLVQESLNGRLSPARDGQPPGRTRVGIH